MTPDGTHMLVGDGGFSPPRLPPLTLPDARSRTDRPADLLPRLGRMACVLAALALPALGIAVADTVHRAGAPRAWQAAAPGWPLDGAARPERHRGETPR